MGHKPQELNRLKRRRYPQENLDDDSYLNNREFESATTFARVSRMKMNSVFRKESNMLWTICVILLILWLLGLLTGYAMGGVIHVLLVIAIIVVLILVIQGRRR